MTIRDRDAGVAMRRFDSKEAQLLRRQQDYVIGSGGITLGDVVLNRREDDGVVGWFRRGCNHEYCSVGGSAAQ